MPALTPENLDRLDPQVAVPDYDRSQVSVGIVHFGVGGFHRAHQAMFLDRLMNQGKALDWGLCGVGVLPSDRHMRDVLKASGGLYTLMLKHPDGHREPRVIGSIVDYLFAPDDPESVIEKMCDPAVRIVSLTVTEGGYNFHHVTGEFDVNNADVKADLEEGAVPKTTFGLVAAAAARRRERGVAPFTIMSCDNIQGNGDTAKKMFTAFAKLKDAEFGEWMEREIPFPNSMVDRITPATTDGDRAEITERYDIVDEWPVVCEPFEQWALEDHFVSGRPPFEEAGVQVVDDVMPYELMKLRSLNATHQGLCYFGYLAGFRLVHDAARDPLIADFLLRYMREEAEPTLSPVPGIDLDAYQRELIERYSNEYVRDTIARLCAESSDRIPKWLLPVIRENLAAGRKVDLSAAIVASWARYAEAVDEQGEEIEIVDRLKDDLVPLAKEQRDDIDAFMTNREVFGDLIDEPAFMEPYRAVLTALHEKGSRAALQDVMGE